MDAAPLITAVRRARSAATIIAALPLILGARPAGAAEERAAPWLSQPALSPDGGEIAFVHSGDLWSAPAAGGVGRLLVSHPADDRRPVFSPDGRRLAFVSDRTGNGDVYVLTLATGDLLRLTHDDGVENLDAWSPDGEWIYYSSTTADVAGMHDIHRVRSAGGTPMPVSAERYTTEFGSAPSPLGEHLLITARGVAAAQWWRNGHSHLDESEIWLFHLPEAREKTISEDPPYRRLVDRGAKSLWPMWSPDAERFWFMSDRSGSENLWSFAFRTATASQLTRFESGRVLWPSIARDGRTIVFERDFGIWSFDTATNRAAPVPITLHGSPAGGGAEHRKLTSGLTEIALSPDGKKIAFIVRGEVFAVSAADGGDATRVTRTPEAERHVAWAPDSRRIVFSTLQRGSAPLSVHDFVAGTTTRVTAGGVDTRPQFSPDGRSVAYLRDGREARIVEVATRKERVLATGHLDFTPPLESTRPLAWSPDGQWLAYLSQREGLFRNASVVRVDGSAAPIPVSFLANRNSETVSWSADGTFLVFDTGQRTEPGQVARVELVPRSPRFREEQFRELFTEKPTGGAGESGSSGAENRPKEKGAAAKDAKAAKPVEVVAEGIRKRLALLPVGVDVQSLLLSPDGKQLLMVAEAEGEANLYLYSLDELAKEPPVAKQLTSTSGAKRSPQWSPDGKTVYYLDDGVIVSIPVESQKPKTIAVSAPLEVAFDSEKRVVFDQVWDWMRRHFHDPAMNGVDWQAVRDTFAPRVAAERGSAELYRLLSMMVGELDASHLGVRGPGTPPNTTGRIGVRFDARRYEKDGTLVISELVPLGPAEVTRRIGIGDRILAVEGVEVGAKTSLEALLANQIDKEVRLTLATGREGRREVRVRPISRTAEKELIYREWVEKSRALVDQLSGGRLGYVHMIDMSYASLLRLAADLDAENMKRDGVVFDVRNNNGGFVNSYALDILSRRHYLDMTFRGWPRQPARPILGQRSLGKPTILLTNQHSLSDAEDFSEGYRTLGLGKVVGEPTSGWIIYTSDEPMIDGSILRLPFITITTANGEPMEMRPRPVDIEVRRTLGEDAAGRDSQIERAVRELLSDLEK